MRLLIGTSAAVATALAILLGGRLADRAGRAAGGTFCAFCPRRAGLRGLLARKHRGGDPAPDRRGATDGQRDGVCTARPRLPAAGARDGRPDRLRSLRARAAACARPRPSNLYALGGLGSLALSRHRFREALAFGRRAQRVSPTTARTYGVIGDALLELGRYGQCLPRLRPHGLAQAEPRGLCARLARTRAARRSPRRHRRDATRRRRRRRAGRAPRVDASCSSASSTSRAAGSSSRSARVPGRARRLPRLRVRARRPRPDRGRPRAPCPRDRARAAQRSSAIRCPSSSASSATSTALQAGHSYARKQYELVGAIERILVANGVQDRARDGALRRRPRRSASANRSRSRAGARATPEHRGDDVLAWALARNGRCDEALIYSRRALRLGTRDALKYFHRGMIERCLGDHASARDWFARALRLNPHFSLLWSPVARRYAS